VSKKFKVLLQLLALCGCFSFSVPAKTDLLSLKKAPTNLFVKGDIISIGKWESGNCCPFSKPLNVQEEKIIKQLTTLLVMFYYVTF